MNQRITAALVGLLLLSGLEPGEALGDPRPTNPDFRFNTFEVLSYQDSAYRFEILNQGDTPPSGFEQPDFDDSGFRFGEGAFGAVRRPAGEPECPLQPTTQTNWPVNSQLLIRRVVSVPAGANNVRIEVSADNDILGVFVNGASLSAPIIHEECPILDEFRFDVPPELIQPGANLVAFHLRDRGDESFFDARILAEFSEEEVEDTLEGIDRVIDRRLQVAPVSNISVKCPSGRQRAIVKFRVDTTRQAGKIIFDQRIRQSPNIPGQPNIPAAVAATRSLAVTAFLGDKLVHSSFLVPRRSANFTVSPDFVGNTPSDTSAQMVFSSVLGREEVIEGVFQCLEPDITAAIPDAADAQQQQSPITPQSFLDFLEGVCRLSCETVELAVDTACTLGAGEACVASAGAACGIAVTLALSCDEASDNFEEACEENCEAE